MRSSERTEQERLKAASRKELDMQCCFGSQKAVNRKIPEIKGSIAGPNMKRFTEGENRFRRGEFYNVCFLLSSKCGELAVLRDRKV